MSPFMKIARIKGWNSKDLADRWGITTRQVSYIAREPSSMHLDALAGLPYRSAGSTPKPERGEDEK